MEDIRPSVLDDNINNFIDRLSLENETCCLKHGPKEMEIKAPPAVDFLCQHIGFKDDNIATEVLRIPICKECAEALLNPEWLLVYCVGCNSSQWIFKPKAYNKVTEGIIWLDECPECKEI